MKRQYYLDNLKLLLTLLVIFHHAAMAHMPGSFWPYHFSDDSMLMPWIWHFLSTNASFFMALFFLIAGYFVPKSFDRQGAKKFVTKKLLHLGIPCVLMTTILSLMVGHMEIGHMWFVENLLFLSLLYALFRVIFRKGLKDNYIQQGPRLILLAFIALAMGGIVQIIRQFCPQDYWIGLWKVLFFEPARYPEYVIMFIVGMFAARYEFFDRMTRDTGLACLAVGALFALGNYLRAGGPWNDFVTRWFGFYESMMSVSLSFGLIWLFREYFSDTDKFLSWSCKQTYWVYIVHLPLMVCLQFATNGMVMPPLFKFIFTGVCTTVISFLASWGINALIALPGKIRSRQATSSRRT